MAAYFFPAYRPGVKPHHPHEIVFLGHSYIRRLHEFIMRSEDEAVCSDFKMNDLFPGQINVQFQGIGGAHVPAVIKRASSVIKECPVQVCIAVLQVGGNDIRRDTDPDKLANHILAAAEYLHFGLEVEQVVISQLFFRESSRVPDYNEIVNRVNFALSSKIAQGDNGRNITFWRHQGFWSPEVRGEIMLRDGVHFNEVGNVKYFKSLKSCLVQAMKRFLFG